MSLVQKINEDFIASFKEKNTIAKSALSQLKNRISLVAKEKKLDTLSDTEVISIIKQQIKQREQSIVEFSRGNRQDLVDIETGELNVIIQYLPKQMSKDELAKEIELFVNSGIDLSTPKCIGLIMAELKRKFDGTYQNSDAAEIINSLRNK